MGGIQEPSLLSASRTLQAPPHPSSSSHVAAPRRFPASPPAPSLLLARGPPAPRPSPPSPPPPTPPRPRPSRSPASRRLPGAVLAAPCPGRPAGGAALPPGSGAAPRLPGPGGERWGRPRPLSRGGLGAGSGRARGGQVLAAEGVGNLQPGSPSGARRPLALEGGGGGSRRGGGAGGRAGGGGACLAGVPQGP